MRSHKAWMAGIAGLLLTTTAANAQIPTIPGAAGAGLGAGATGTSALGAASGAAGAPRTVWSMLGLSHENLAACKLKICRSPIGQALNGFATGPLSAVTGGLLSNCCPPPTPGEIAALEAKGGPQGAQAVAAKIQADEADAKARVAAVDYLGTVDCRYWKEAQIALLNALRADRNECVRFAAARAFNNGCCCSKEVIETLRIVVAGEDSDGFPAESSSRIKGTSFAALQNCLMKVGPTIGPNEPLEPEQGPAAVPAPPSPELIPERSATASTLTSVPTHVAASHLEPIPTSSQTKALAIAGKPMPGLSIFESRVRFRSFGSVVTEARKTLYEVAQTSPSTSATAGLPAGKQSVLHALVKARQDVVASQGPRLASGSAPMHNASAPASSLPSLQPTPSQPNNGSAMPFQAPEAPAVPDIKIAETSASTETRSLPKVPATAQPLVNVPPKVEVVEDASPAKSGIEKSPVTILPVEIVPEANAPMAPTRPKLAPSAPKLSLSTPRVPSQSLPAAEPPEMSFHAMEEPTLPMTIASENVKNRASAKNVSQKTDRDLLEVSTSVSSGKLTLDGKDRDGTVPIATSSSSFDSAPKPSSNRKASTRSTLPASRKLVNEEDLPPLPPEFASAPLASPTIAKPAEKKSYSLFGFGKKAKPATVDAPPAARPASEGKSLLSAFVKAKKDAEGGPKPVKPAVASKLTSVSVGKPVSNLKPAMPVNDVSKSRSKLDTDTKPASYWDAPRPRSNDNEADLGSTDPEVKPSDSASKRAISRIFPTGS